MMDICIFDVGLGQSIFFYPNESTEHSMLVDCGDCSNFCPTRFIKQYLPNNTLGNLTITNYDQDHFSGIVTLANNVSIKTINFANNLSDYELISLKSGVTDALRKVLEIRGGSGGVALDWNPPYTKYIFSLDKNELTNPTTNNLSQLVFVDYKGFVVCIPGDLEREGWEKILKQPMVKSLLQRTRLFVASHHGRDNGYFEEVFYYCSPECVIISDDSIQCNTQEAMSTVYGNKVNGIGIMFDDNLRKVLTTRNDGHLIVKVNDYGLATYYKLKFNT